MMRIAKKVEQELPAKLFIESILCIFIHRIKFYSQLIPSGSSF